MAIDDQFEALAKQYPKDEPVASAAVTAWKRLTDRDEFRNRTEETQAILVERLKALEPEYERLDKEKVHLRVDGLGVVDYGKLNRRFQILNGISLRAISL